MAKLVSGFPAVNAEGSTRNDYSLIKVLSAQVSQMLNTIHTKSEDFTAADGYVCLMTSGSIVDVKVNLPAIASNLGAIVVVVKVDAGTKKIILDGNASETINGATTLELASQWSKATVLCTSSGWIQIA